MAEAQRRLAAIMFTDMVGYTALGQRNEDLSLALVEEQRGVVRPILVRHNGREVKTMGDAFLVEFPNSVDAVRCAYDIQRAVREFNFSLSPDRRIHLRVGVHVGEVVGSTGDISGDAVNVSSRIEPLAEDGGVCLSRQVYDFVKNKVDIPLLSLGQKSLKNVAEPMEVYRMVMPWERDTAPPPPPSERNRVAVLPFVNMSPDPNDEYFADGMTEELIDRLAQVKQLKVIARTSVMSYKKKDKKAGEIARELLVGSLVEGSVRKAGNRIRVTVQLIGAGNEEHIWSSRYDGILDDIFAVQSEIAEKVAGELKAQLLESEKKTLQKRPTENVEAYSDYLRGRELRRDRSEATVRQALKLFERAVELDPSFARAHLGVFSCKYLLSFGHEPRDAILPAAKASLKRALELDPELAEAHASYAGMLVDSGDILGAEAEAKRALELDPSLPWAYFMLCPVAAVKGEKEEALRCAETAYRLDPINPSFIWGLGAAYLAVGMEKEALEHWKKTEHLAPALTYGLMSDYHLSKGDIGKAKEFNVKRAALEPTSLDVVVTEGVIDATAGEKEKALLSIKKVEEMKMGPLTYVAAYIYQALGDMDKFFELMNRALEEHVLEPTTLMYSPVLAKARADPRYAELMERFREKSGLAK